MTTDLRRAALFALLALLITPAARAQSVVGDWLTIDDETETKRSVVEIYEENGALFARVKHIFPKEGEPEDPVCIACKGRNKDQRILGMVIMWDMKPDGDEWKGGRILDPEKGKTYRAKIWLEDGRLRVRGYLGPFYRTQTWLPAEEG